MSLTAPIDLSITNVIKILSSDEKHFFPIQKSTLIDNLSQWQTSTTEQQRFYTFPPASANYLTGISEVDQHLKGLVHNNVLFVC